MNKLALAVLALLAVALPVAPLSAQVPPPPTIVRSSPANPTSQVAPLPAAPTAPFTVTNYDLALAFNFPAHQLDVTAKVTLVPSSPISSADFRLNQNLQVQSVTDAAGGALSQQRQLDHVIVTFNAPLAANTPAALTFHYAGALADANLSPISGIRTAYVGPEGAFLLYPGEWFPVTGYGTDRFTATISTTLPASMAMIASGAATTTPSGNGVTYQFQQATAGFPGSVIVTPLKPQDTNQDGLTSHFYFSPDVPADLAAKYAAAASQVYNFLVDTYGTAPTRTLTFVELPSDALPSFSSPGLIVLSRASIGSTVNANLLVDEIAQQWFGCMISPQSMNDAWLQYGAARFSESLYVERTQGKAAWQDLVQELEVGALSYPDTALATSSQLYVFSPQFQDLNYDKGAMLFHMLRWTLGDQPFNNALRDFVNTYANKSVTTAQFEQSLEKSTKADLRSFFSQWYEGTAIPTFTNQYTTYRLQKGGYRVTGRIQQNLDLFNMPVELAVQTDGATETRTVQVSGTDCTFTVDLAGRPRKVTVDPNDWILKASPELNLRVDLSRGDNLVAAGDFPNAIKQYQEALKLNPISSLANYRMAEAYFQEKNWQNAADAYRQAMNGDLNPSWVAVWSHIQLGKIFDLTGQRNRALNEYQLAIATHDDTNGALETARDYLKTPYSGTNTSGQ
ncbi:MAG TPA: M1 family aminopeptidase [Terriglobales bacterium]|nr:M1 family aminopeptidase [Terriglobales bacterium]